MNDQITDFLAEMRAERKAAQEKEQREAWTKYTSLSIVFIAVLAAVASQCGGGYSSGVLTSLNEATFNQAAASDQWSYYQAKSIKQTIAEGEEARAVQAGDSKLADELRAKIKRYDTEKAEITAKAKSFEAAREQARQTAAYDSRKGNQMGLSISLYQISIAVASICLVMKKKGLWWLSLAFAAAAAVQMVHAMRM